MNIAIIPARGGSKGVKGKNLAKVGGIPLISRTIRAAYGAEWVHLVVVSTDSKEIADEARKEGAEVVMRPDYLASDSATSEDALLHALQQYPDANNMAFLQCTSPFTRSAEIDACMKMLDEGYDSVFTVSETHSGYWRRADLQCVSHNAGIQRQGRQVTPPLWRETGAVYALRVKGFKKSMNRFFGKMGVFLVSEKSAFEIDNPGDLAICKMIADATERD